MTVVCVLRNVTHSTVQDDDDSKVEWRRKPLKAWGPLPDLPGGNSRRLISH